MLPRQEKAKRTAHSSNDMGGTTEDSLPTSFKEEHNDQAWQAKPFFNSPIDSLYNDYRQVEERLGRRFQYREGYEKGDVQAEEYTMQGCAQS